MNLIDLFIFELDSESFSFWNSFNSSSSNGQCSSILALNSFLKFETWVLRLLNILTIRSSSSFASLSSTILASSRMQFTFSVINWTCASFLNFTAVSSHANAFSSSMSIEVFKGSWGGITPIFKLILVIGWTTFACTVAIHWPSSWVSKTWSIFPSKSPMVCSIFPTLSFTPLICSLTWSILSWIWFTSSLTTLTASSTWPRSSWILLMLSLTPFTSSWTLSTPSRTSPTLPSTWATFSPIWSSFEAIKFFGGQTIIMISAISWSFLAFRYSNLSWIFNTHNLGMLKL